MLLIVAALFAPHGYTAVQAQVEPVVRFRMATVAAGDIAAVEAAYTGWLAYEVVERGTVAQSLAAAWATPAMAGRAYIVMQPASGVDVYIRAVEVTPPTNYHPMTTLGW